MLIYKVTNKINGKIYVGQTVGDLNRRRSAHLSSVKTDKYDIYFYKAIKKYGKENFDWVILEKCNTIKELNEKEEYWIKELNTTAPDGYNLKSGGNNSTHHKESIKKMKKVKEGKYIGEKNPFYGKKHTDESIKKMKENRLDTKGENNPMYGKKHTKKSLKKMKELKIGENNPFYGKFHTEETLKKMSGEKHSHAKLTESDVIDIRELYKYGMKQCDLSRLKGVSWSCVDHIIKRRTWKHI